MKKWILTIKDAMPVYFRSELFTAYILTIHVYLSSETYSRKCEKLSYKILQKNVFVENVRPEYSAWLIYVSTHCVERVKWLDYDRYSQLTRWCRSNAYALSERGPGFNHWLRQLFLCLLFCFDVVFLLFVQKHIICHKSHKSLQSPWQC